MQLTTGNLNLKKGENTYIEVKLTSLQNLPDTALLTITNMTPGVVTMTNGNVQVITISPVARLEVFSVRSDAVSIATGDFKVTVDLDLPGGPPPVFADVRKPEGGKRDEGVLTACTRTALEIGMKKWADANTEGKNAVDYECI